MDTTTITKEQLNLFVVCGKHYVTNAKASVLKSAISELLPTALKKLKKVERQKELARLNLCKKTASRHIDLDKEGRYQYTEEDHARLLERFDEIDEETVEMPTIIVTDYPDEGLTYDLRRGFEGIVLPKAEEAVPE